MKYKRLFCIISGVLWTALSAIASDFSFVGALNYDTDVQFFNFTVTAGTPTPALRTYSYAGGINSAGDTILAGGFDPVLDLYLADGTGMNPGTPGPCGGILPQDPTTGGCEDVYYPTTLSFPGGTWAPGTYIVALTDNVNAGLGNLSDGFFGVGVLGLTAPDNFSCGSSYQGVPPGGSATNAFCDDISPYPAAGAQRDGVWALDITGVSSASEGLPSATPEPGTLSLSLLAAAALVIRARRGKGDLARPHLPKS